MSALLLIACFFLGSLTATSALLINFQGNRES